MACRAFLIVPKAADVGHFLCVCITHTDFKRMAATVAPFENVSLSVGNYPNEQLEDEPTIQDLVQLANISEGSCNRRNGS